MELMIGKEISIGEFTNKVAILTGSTSGIGRATTIAFARAGAKVVTARRREDEGNELVNAIRQAGGLGSFRQDRRVQRERCQGATGHSLTVDGGWIAK